MASVYIIIQHLNEDASNLFLGEATTSSFPRIESRDNMDFNDDPHEFIVKAEGVEVCRCVEFGDAVALLFGAYYIFNIHFAPKFGSTLNFIGRTLLNINPDSHKKDIKISKLCVALGMDQR